MEFFSKAKSRSNSILFFLSPVRVALFWYLIGCEKSKVSVRLEERGGREEPRARKRARERGAKEPRRLAIGRGRNLKRRRLPMLFLFLSLVPLPRVEALQLLRTRALLRGPLAPSSRVERERERAFSRSVPFKKEGKQKISKRERRRRMKNSPRSPTIERKQNKNRRTNALPLPLLLQPFAAPPFAFLASQSTAGMGRSRGGKSGSRVFSTREK